eukprot:SAG31_NODE_1102_length_9897_cov_16.273015_13_plen_144_part_00
MAPRLSSAGSALRCSKCARHPPRGLSEEVRSDPTHRASGRTHRRRRGSSGAGDASLAAPPAEAAAPSCLAVPGGPRTSPKRQRRHDQQTGHRRGAHRRSPAPAPPAPRMGSTASRRQFASAFLQARPERSNPPIKCQSSERSL